MLSIWNTMPNRQLVKFFGQGANRKWRHVFIEHTGRRKVSLESRILNLVAATHMRWDHLHRHAFQAVVATDEFFRVISETHTKVRKPKGIVTSPG